MMSKQRLLAIIILFVLGAVSTIDAAQVSFHPTAKKFNCPCCDASTRSTPTKLTSLSLDKGNGVTKYILLEPHYTEGQLCTLTRNNDEFNPIQIPIARSFDDNPNWNKSAGRYVSSTAIICGEADADGPTGSGYVAGETLCQIKVPPLELTDEGYFLTVFDVKDQVPLADAASHQTFHTEKGIVAKFLSSVTFGATTDQIDQLADRYQSDGPIALANWLYNIMNNVPISSHRAHFRSKLHPRAVESYQYAIRGPRPCEAHARFRRFALTYMDCEISRGSSSPADNTGLPFTQMKIETIDIGGVTYYALKFGDDLRTILDTPLQYYAPSSGVSSIRGPSADDTLTDLPDGSYTICNVEEVMGNQVGGTSFAQIGNYAVQILVGASCTSSYTYRGSEDFKGDGSIDTQQIKVSGTLVRSYDSNQCNAKCGNGAYVRYVQGGNPEVKIPAEFDKSTIPYVDLTTLDNPATQLVNLNADKFHDSSWKITTNLPSYVSDPPSCVDENGDVIPDPAGSAYNDYFSTGRGKYNLDPSIFAKMPNGKWALHDYRSLFQANTVQDPLPDAGGEQMIRARRGAVTPYGDGSPDIDLVTRCSNVERNIFNEGHCKISYDVNACETVPAPDPDHPNYIQQMNNPGTNFEDVDKYLPSYRGYAGVVVCGSEDEVAPDPLEDDHYAVSNRHVNTHRTDYTGQIRTVWMELALHAPDQPCQKLAWVLSKIISHSHGHGEEEIYISSYDNFVTSCNKTYKEVVRRMTHNVELGEQLTFINNKGVQYDWHRNDKINYPDENYAREHLQLISLGFYQLNDDGSPKLNSFGRKIANYAQSTISEASKIFTGLGRSYRRAGYNDLDRTTSSYLDHLKQRNIEHKDWGPKIGLGESYVGDQYPLCSDLPEKHFLRKGATFVALGGNILPQRHRDPTYYYTMTLDFEGANSNGVPSPLFEKICQPKSFQNPASSLVAGTGFAAYDSTFGAPVCEGINYKCDSGGSLLVGRNTESNGPNTIDTCEDGSSVDNEYDESVSAIVVETVGGESSPESFPLRGGSLVSIKATVIAYNKNDKVDYYVASDATNPDWKFITTVAPTEGEQVVTVPYDAEPEIRIQLPPCYEEDSCKQAVRVSLRSSRIRNDDGSYKSRIRSGDGLHKPSNSCAAGTYDDSDDIVIEVLPTVKPSDRCDFQSVVVLDENLACHGRECNVDTVRVVEVAPGVFYEYKHLACVNMPFYPDPAKVFAGSDYNVAMCADKRLTSALPTCCGGYADRKPEATLPWADVLLEYRNERTTYNGNVERCLSWGRYACDPVDSNNHARIGPFSGWRGHCHHRKSCQDVDHGGLGKWLHSVRYHWTTAGCQIWVKVDVAGLIALVHVPEQTGYVRTSDTHPATQNLVDYDLTVSFFHVHWDSTNVPAGKLPYPHVNDNQCDGGEIRDEYCFCSTTLQEEIVFSAFPASKEVVLSQLKVGHFDPDMLEGYTTLAASTPEITVYKKDDEADYSIDTIFRVVNVYTGGFLYLKNVRSKVSVCNDAFSFRTPVSFYNLNNPTILDAEYELDAYLDHVNNHDSAPPFTCTSLMKHFDYPNASPPHVAGCSEAFKSGRYEFRNPENPSQTVSFGDGERGNLNAVLASIVLSPEATSPTVILDPAGGAITDPWDKVVKLMSRFELTREAHVRRMDGFIAGNTRSIIGVAPHSHPDQFSFYDADFTPAGTMVGAGLVSPPAQIVTVNYVTGLANALFNLPRFGLSVCNGGVGGGWNRAYYSNNCVNTRDGLHTNIIGHLQHTPHGDLTDASNVVDQISLLLTDGRLSDANRKIIEDQFNSSLNAGSIFEAIQVATVLMLAAPEFHTTNLVDVTSDARTGTPSRPVNENVPYKAVVHVNLFGGCDTLNMLMPHPDGCSALYDEYTHYRGANALDHQNEMIRIDATTSDSQPCTYFGVHKQLPGLAEMYNDGDAAFIANIGHLQKFVDRYNYQEETLAQLFGHHTMKQEMLKVDAIGATLNSGVLGRIADVVMPDMSVGLTSIQKASTILKGDPSIATPVQVVKQGGVEPFYQNEICQEPASAHDEVCTTGSSYSKRDALLPLFKALNSKTEPTSSIQAEFWAQSFFDTMEDSDELRSILKQACQTDADNPGTFQDISCSSHGQCPAGCYCSGKCTGGSELLVDAGGLGKQLNMVYQLMSVHEARGKNRDFFAVEMGGFDSHFSMKESLNALFSGEVNPAIKGFRDALKLIGLWESTTVVMTSEFGRTISPNASGGTDHAWSGNAFIAGGKIKGGVVLGKHPTTYNPSDDMNTGRGVFIPKVPWEAMWYGITQWAGITNDAATNYVLPNLASFGCEVYSEVDLYIDGVETTSGCGGSVIDMYQTFLISQPRLLSVDEQKDFISIIVASMPEGIRTRCFIKSQTLSVVSGSARTLEETNAYELNVDYVINFEEGVTDAEAIATETINNENFEAEVTASIQMEVTVEEAIVATQSPSISISPSTSTMPSAKNEPSQSPSLSAVPSGLPSLSTSPSETVVIGIPAYYGYDLVGDGECEGKLDGNSPFATAKYNYLQYQDTQFVAPTHCPAVCAAYRQFNEFRGFEFESEVCRCLFDSDIDLDAIALNYGTSPQSILETNRAKGTVVGVAGSSSIQCYKISLPQAPEEVTSFEYIGYGNCWDANLNAYDYISISFGENDFAIECGSACSATTYPLSRGFFTQEGATCHCLFDDGADGSVDGGTGTGAIVYSDAVAGHCYKSVPPPTKAPTKPPTPPPTARPTNPPTRVPSSAPSESSYPSKLPSFSPSTSSAPSISLAPSESSGPSSSISSKPSVSSSPSNIPEPSQKPSRLTSVSPSESLVPSDKPTRLLSVSPSESLVPSDKPSRSPSVSPSESFVPSHKPTRLSSISPSKSFEPSMMPTKTPTQQFSASFEGTVTIAGSEVMQLLGVDNFTATLQSKINAFACPANENASVQACTVVLKTMNGVAVTRKLNLRNRSLQPELVIEFELLLDLICATEECSDAQATANAVYNESTGSLKDALDDGSLITQITTDLPTTTSLLADAVLTANFSGVVVPLIGLLSLWYPAWESRETSCKNDGAMPFYMEQSPHWLELSKAKCCERYFSWAYADCVGQDQNIVGFYPLWGGSEHKCETGNPPSYMLTDKDWWIPSTVEECCLRFFWYDASCITNSGGVAPVDPTESMYYADWITDTNTCVNDGKAPLYKKNNPSLWMYDTLSECCKSNYAWGDKYNECMASENPPVVESWYVNWTTQICVKNCIGSTPCGGLAKSWDVLHPTKSLCCSEHLWWRKDCLET